MVAEQVRDDVCHPVGCALPVDLERLPDASHWVHHDEVERVNQLLTDFFAPARAAGH